MVVDGVEGAVEVVEPVRATVKRKCKQHGLDWSLALATAAPEGIDAPEEVLEEEPVEDPSAVEYMAPVAGLAGEQPEHRDVFCALSALWRDVGASAREELAPILLDAEKQEEADQAIAEDEDLLDAEAQAASPSDVAEAGPSAPAGAGPSAPAEAEPPADVSPLAPSIAVGFRFATSATTRRITFCRQTTPISSAPSLRWGPGPCRRSVRGAMASVGSSFRRLAIG